MADYLGLTMILLGVLLMIIGFILLLKPPSSSKGKIESDYGAIVLIGPIPIIIAKRKSTALVLLLIAIIIVVFLYILSYWYRR